MRKTFGKKRSAKRVIRTSGLSSPPLLLETDASAIASECDTLSETCTLVESDDIAHTLRITTLFQETDPELRETVYREYIARSSPREEPDDQELDRDDMAWACTSSRHATFKSRGKGAWCGCLARLVRRLRSLSEA